MLVRAHLRGDVTFVSHAKITPLLLLGVRSSTLWTCLHMEMGHVTCLRGFLFFILTLVTHFVQDGVSFVQQYSLAQDQCR